MIGGYKRGGRRSPAVGGAHVCGRQLETSHRSSLQTASLQAAIIAAALYVQFQVRIKINT